MEKKSEDAYIVQGIIFHRANRQGMRMCELARRIGVSYARLNNWKRNKSQMRMEYAEKCFEALNEDAQEKHLLIY